MLKRVSNGKDVVGQSDPPCTFSKTTHFPGSGMLMQGQPMLDSPSRVQYSRIECGNVWAHFREYAWQCWTLRALGLGVQNAWLQRDTPVLFCENVSITCSPLFWGCWVDREGGVALQGIHILPLSVSMKCLFTEVANLGIIIFYIPLTDLFKCISQMMIRYAYFNSFFSDSTWHFIWTG